MGRLLLLFAALVAVVLGGACGPTAFACANDDDCPLGTVCAGGACAVLSNDVDGGVVGVDAGGGGVDAGPVDAGFARDAGADAGFGVDAGVDAGFIADAGFFDAGFVDAGADAGFVDAGPCIVGEACDDGIACTVNDLCIGNHVCLGVPSGNLDCGMCNVSCATMCSPCCEQPQVDDCDKTCGVCIGKCDGSDCNSSCNTQGVCTVSDVGGGLGGSLTCDGATCRGELGASAAPIVLCENNAVCDVFVHDITSTSITCTDSTCKVLVEGSGGGNTVHCTGSSCQVAADNINLTVVCSESTCAVDLSAGTYVVDCSLAANCSVTTTQAGCTLTCGDSSTCTVNGSTCPSGQDCDCSN